MLGARKKSAVVLGVSLRCLQFSRFFSPFVFLSLLLLLLLMSRYNIACKQQQGPRGAPLVCAGARRVAAHHRPQRRRQVQHLSLPRRPLEGYPGHHHQALQGDLLHPAEAVRTARVCLLFVCLLLLLLAVAAAASHTRACACACGWVGVHCFGVERADTAVVRVGHINLSICPHTTHTHHARLLTHLLTCTHTRSHRSRESDT